MVNPGHRSKACLTCKRRRIKCDERRPNCLKCEVSKRACLGYRDHSVFKAHRFNSTPEMNNMALQPPTSSDCSKTAVRSDNIGREALSAACQFGTDQMFIDLLRSIGIKFTENLMPAIQAILEVVKAGLQSLQAQYLTFEAHRNMQQKYQLAMRELRVILPSGTNSQISWVPPYLFAFYEVSMIRIFTSGY